jgi:hypothetical protein
MRRGVAAVAIAALVLAAAAAPARAGTFRVSQCNHVEGGGLSPRLIQAELWSTANGWPISACGTPGGTVRFDTGNHRLAHYWDMVVVFALPGSMPLTGMRTAWLDWQASAQAPSTNPAYLIASSAGTVLFDVPSGSGTVPGAAQRLPLPIGARDLRLTTWCSPANGPGWCNWPSQLLELRGLTVELEETGEPSAAASGALTENRPHAGTEALWIDASDGDSGVRQVTASLGGVAVGTIDSGELCRDDRLPPCPPALRRTIDVDTTKLPDGVHRLRLVVSDAAANRRTVDAGTVLVRNQAPAAGSANPSPAAPNTLGATPNPVVASERAIISAWLEPRRGVRRRAVTAAYGRRLRVRGRVRDEAGRPVGDAILMGIEREPGRRPRVTTRVRTRRDGRFTASTRVGASRTVRFAYGTARSRRLRVAVRAPVRIRAWTAGGATRIRGRLGGRRVPRGGVLVELQRLLQGRWTGVGALRTRPDGRFAARLTGRGAPARLRAVVPAQPGLPFATGRSPAVRAR